MFKRFDKTDKDLFGEEEREVRIEGILNPENFLVSEWSSYVPHPPDQKGKEKKKVEYRDFKIVGEHHNSVYIGELKELAEFVDVLTNVLNAYLLKDQVNEKDVN